MIDRPKFNEMTYDDIRYYDKNWTSHVEKWGYYDTIEMKMDGIWGCMVVKDGVKKHIRFIMILEKKVT